MSSYPHPPQGYYGGGPPPEPPPGYPPNYNSYDLPPRGGPTIPMPPPPRHSWIHYKRHIGFSIIFWVVFLLIDLFAHQFPTYPWSARRNYSGRTTLIVVYTFIFQIFWFLYVGGRTSYDIYVELKAWWNRGQKGTVKILGMIAGGLGILVLVGFPAVALGFNAKVAATRKKD